MGMSSMLRTDGSSSSMRPLHCYRHHHNVPLHLIDIRIRVVAIFCISTCPRNDTSVCGRIGISNPSPSPSAYHTMSVTRVGSSSSMVPSQLLSRLSQIELLGSLLDEDRRNQHHWKIHLGHSLESIFFGGSSVVESWRQPKISLWRLHSRKSIEMIEHANHTIRIGSIISFCGFCSSICPAVLQLIKVSSSFWENSPRCKTL